MSWRGRRWGPRWGCSRGDSFIGAREPLDRLLRERTRPKFEPHLLRARATQDNKNNKGSVRQLSGVREAALSPLAVAPTRDPHSAGMLSRWGRLMVAFAAAL